MFNRLKNIFGKSANSNQQKPKEKEPIVPRFSEGDLIVVDSAKIILCGRVESSIIGVEGWGENEEVTTIIIEGISSSSYDYLNYHSTFNVNPDTKVKRVVVSDRLEFYFGPYKNETLYILPILKVSQEEYELTIVKINCIDQLSIQSSKIQKMLDFVNSANIEQLKSLLPKLENLEAEFEDVEGDYYL